MRTTGIASVIFTAIISVTGLGLVQAQDSQSQDPMRFLPKRPMDRCRLSIRELGLSITDAEARFRIGSTQGGGSCKYPEPTAEHKAELDLQNTAMDKMSKWPTNFDPK